MKNELNYGVYPTMLTPYKKDGTVDISTAEKYVRWYFDKGCAGIFALCHSSESWDLSFDEKLSISTMVYRVAKELERESGRLFTVVTSGHTAESIERQAYELLKLYERGSDAMIFMTNRFDLNCEGDAVFLKNLEKMLSLIPDDIRLGLYETPYPYKRLVTPEILKYCADTGRFYFMKDTCCNIDMIRERLDVIKGSNLKLMNANAQTLLESLKYGAAGYSSVMANIHPELYVYLCQNYDSDPQKCELLQNFLGTLAFTEVGLPYPLSAKYNMCLEGIPTENISRVRNSDDLTEYAKDCVRQMRELTRSFPSLLGINI